MVTINGTGFGTSPAVQFNGVNANVLSVTNTRIVTTVPAVGVTGQIQIAVTTSQGTVNAPFTVLAADSGPRIQVAPSYVSILPGETLQFFATVSGITGDQSVQWSVNGIQGGDSYVGTISTSGFYTAPNQPGFVFTIRATSVANQAVFGQAQVAILDSSLAEVVLARPVSVLRQATVTEATPGTSVSVRRLVPDSVAPVTQISVRRLSSVDTGAPQAAAISVRRNDASTPGSPQSAGVSLTTGPLVQSLSPASAAKGTSFTLTLNGINFDGATALTFLTTAGAVDSTISVSNISVATGGASLTATVTVSGSAAVGQRVVVVTTAAGNSLMVALGTNVLEITQ
jgi:hypothetical protein